MDTMETKQTLKEVMALWKDAVTSYNAGNSERCLEVYGKVEEKSGRIHYNMGCAYIKLNRKTEALQSFTKAVEKDPHLAIAFFQRGVVQLESKRLDEAMSDFVTSRDLLRGNTFIYYKQLGLLCKLHLCEVLYNMALVNIFKGNENEAGKLLMECKHETEYKHKTRVLIANEYLQGRMNGTDLLTPMTVSSDVIFTPPKDVVDNLDKKNVMGKAKVVSAKDLNDLDPTFNGPKRVEELKLTASQSPCKKTFLQVKRFLKKPAAKQDRRKSTGILVGQSEMKVSQSMMDLRVRSGSEAFLSKTLPSNTLITQSKQKSNSTLKLNILKSSSAQQLKWSFGNKSPSDKNNRKVSLGSIFGNTLSPLNSALSASFDVLTAVVAPITDDNLGRGFSPISLNHELYNSSSDDSISEVDEDLNDGVFIDYNTLGESPSLKTEPEEQETNSVKIEPTKCVFDFSDTNCPEMPGRDVNKENMSEDNYHVKRNSGLELRSPRGRKIPPPPSYPPPPLPPNIVITVSYDQSE